MKYSLIVLGVVAVALIAAPAQAQSSGGRPVWDIPFDFIVGEETLPAGRYTVDRGVTPGTVAVCRLDGNGTRFRLSDTIWSGKAPEHSVLVFSRYGSQHFLSRVWIAGREDGSVLKKSKLERELAHGRSGDAVAMVAR